MRNELMVRVLILTALAVVLILGISYYYPRIAPAEDIVRCNLEGGYSWLGPFGEAHVRGSGWGCSSINYFASNGDSGVCYGLTNSAQKAICLGTSSKDPQEGVSACKKEFGESIEKDICAYNVLIEQRYSHSDDPSALSGICSEIENGALKARCYGALSLIFLDKNYCEGIAAEECRCACIMFSEANTDGSSVPCFSGLPKQYSYYTYAEGEYWIWGGQFPENFTNDTRGCPHYIKEEN